jgi:hypothetical protein
MFSSIEQRLHTSFDIFIPIRRSLQIEQKFKRESRLRSKISYQLKTLNIPENEIPNPPPLSNDSHFNKVMDCIRKFELEQISLHNDHSSQYHHDLANGH